MSRNCQPFFYRPFRWRWSKRRGDALGFATKLHEALVPQCPACGNPLRFFMQGPWRRLAAHLSDEVWRVFWCPNPACDSHYTAIGEPYFQPVPAEIWKATPQPASSIILGDLTEDRPEREDDLQWPWPITDSKLGGYPYFSAVAPPEGDGEFLALIHDSDAPNVNLPQGGSLHLYDLNGQLLYELLW